MRRGPWLPPASPPAIQPGGKPTLSGVMGSGNMIRSGGRLLVLGDSNVNNASSGQTLHTDSTVKIPAYHAWRGPFGPAQARLGWPFTFAVRTNGGDTGTILNDLDHGYGGYTNEYLRTGYPQPNPTIFPVTHALSVGPDAILYCVTGNDLAGGATSSQSLAQITLTLAALKASGKPVYLTNVLPRGSGIADASTYRDKKDDLNTSLVTLASQSRVPLLQWDSYVSDEDGYLPTDYQQGGGDMVHLNNAGGLLLVQPLADFLFTYVGDPISWGDTWLTSNPHVTAGADNALPDGWARYTAAAGASYTYSKVTDGDGTVWRRITVSGAAADGLSQFGLLDNALDNAAGGGVVRTSMRLRTQPGSTFRGITGYCDLTVDGVARTLRYLPISSAAHTVADPLIGGLFLSEPLTLSATCTGSFQRLLFYGNGTLDFREAGTRLVS